MVQPCAAAPGGERDGGRSATAIVPVDANRNSRTAPADDQRLNASVSALLSLPTLGYGPHMDYDRHIVIRGKTPASAKRLLSVTQGYTAAVCAGVGH